MLHLFVSYCLDMDRISFSSFWTFVPKSIGRVFFFFFFFLLEIHSKNNKNDSRIRMSQGDGIERN